MPRKNIHITKETEKQLKEVEAFNGAKHSAIIRVAVDKYHKEVVKGDHESRILSRWDQQQ